MFNNKLKEVLSLLKDKLFGSHLSNEEKLLVIDVLVWITKGLVISKHCLRKEFIDLIINLCEDNNHMIRTYASKGFETIHMSEDNCLTEDNNANVTILFNQRFYFETFDSLLSSYSKQKKP